MNLKHRLLASGAFGRMTANERRLGRFIRDGEGHPAPTPSPAPAPADPAPAPSEPEPDAFSSAFAEHITDPAAGADGDGGAAAGAAGAAPAAPAEGDAGAASAAGAPPAAAGEASAQTPPADAGGTPAAQPAAAGADAGTPAVDPAAEDVLRRLAGMIQSGSTPPAAEAPAAGAAAEAPPAQPLYTQDELGVLQDYEKNWPEVARAETLRRRAEYHDLAAYIFQQIAGYVGPTMEQVKAMGNTLHTSELKQAVPDYSETLEQEVATWVDKQPSYLQGAMKQVMQGGTSEEVADLIRRYRAETGTTPPAAPAAAAPAAAAPAPAAAAPATPKPSELSQAAKQAVASLAPVSGDRSAVPQGEDTQDFGSAFQKYAASI